MRARFLDSYDELPEPALRWLAQASADGLFQSLPWLRACAAQGLWPGQQIRLVLVEPASADQVAPQALLPAVHSRNHVAHRGALLLNFVTSQALVYEPVVPSGMAPADADALATAVLATIADQHERYDVVRMDPLDPDSPFTAAIVPALRGAGWWVQALAAPGCRYVDVTTPGFQGFLAQRPRRLRETLEQHTRLLLQGGRGHFEFPCTPELLEEAWVRVEHVMQTTVASGEPLPPGTARALMRVAAQAGSLRLGLFHLDGLPVAMQWWVLGGGGTAHCLRFWSPPARQAFPIDDVLTQLIVLCLIDGDHVARLEFGDLSEAYARDWAPAALARVGVLAFNRRSWRGLTGMARHRIGSAFRNLLRRFF